MSAHTEDNRRLLVLDDEVDVIESYRVILEPQQNDVQLKSSRKLSSAQPSSEEKRYEVQYVSQGEKALEVIEESIKSNKPFAGAFFDVKLGDSIDGIETLRRAKEIDPNLLYVLVTAYQDRSIEEITTILGAEISDRWDFLAKPFTQAEIRQKANNLVADWNRRNREHKYLEQIQAQQAQLIQSERMAAVGTLARGVGHEFGNVLLSIIGNSELAVKSKEPEEMEEALNLVVRSATRAGVIVRNLQKMVGSDRNRQWIEIEQPLNAALELIAHEFKKWRVTLDKQLSPNLAKIKANEIELSQVFLNLFINAVHAMQPDAGTVTIRTAEKDGGIAIDISDSGCGISQENIHRIFEPLFTTKGGKGSGIGLSVCKRIMEQHGGTLNVESEVDKGTTFKIWLPSGG